MSLALAGSLIACAPKDSQDTSNGDNTQNEQSSNNNSGNNQGGSNQGGDNQGGNNQGGNNQGGDNQGGDNQGGETPTPLPAVSYPNNPNFGWDVSVHDPSIFRDDDGTYYAFGSHFAIASSTDLMHWTQRTIDFPESSFAEAKRKLYGRENFREVLAQSNSLVGGDQNTWAPDVEKIGDKYYMYYSLTSGFGSNQSVIGRVEWDKNLNHFTNEEILVYSDGGPNSPNAIDPELFYDKEGRLWMVYGSFFAGIYIRQLNTEGARAGLPINDDIHDYGTLLWKGGGSGVEGPFIFYNAETDYYYLMVSDGSLRNDERHMTNPEQANYNMRVARSRTPDGDYQDIMGAFVAYEYGHGNKLAGNYQFTGDIGYGAQGHNSVIEVDGEYFVVSHVRTRMDNTSDKISLGHSVMVNQLYFNAQGWPVMSPERYAGEHLGKVTETALAGNYDILLHTQGNSYSFATSSAYKLASDGAIKLGSLTAGSWTLSQDYYITLVLNGAVYQGVVAPVWCRYRSGNKGVLSITATSADGRALWAIGGAAEPKGFTLTDSGTEIREFHAGNVSDVAIGAFDASEGFSVSFLLNADGASDVWHSPVIVTAGGLGMHLANLDAWFASGILNRTNRNAQNADIQLGAYEQVFLHVYPSCFVTVTVTSDGINYYKDGTLVISYAAARFMRYNNDQAKDSDTVTVGHFISALMDAIEDSGFVFAWSGDALGRISAKDMFLTNALSASQAASLKSDYAAFAS